MKRLIIFATLICLILCGCAEGATSPTESTAQTQPSTEASTPATQPSTQESTPATQPSTEPDPEPTQPEPEMVTVYLLTKTSYYDNGGVEYRYDENYNIDSATVFSLENTTLYEQFFEDKDANGMPCVIRSRWAGESSDEILNLTYQTDGKLKEEQNGDGSFSGYQYEYDQKGNRTAKREYYDGLLQTVVYYEYDADVLKSVYCEDDEGNMVYKCRIENGLIVEKVLLDWNAGSGYRYTYDANGNLAEVIFYFEGEDIPGDHYFYQAVEVDAERAAYLLEQQKYLIAIT